MSKFVLATLAIFVLAACGDTIYNYYGDDAVSTDSRPAPVENDTVQSSSDTLSIDVFVVDSVQPSADTFVSNTSGEEDTSVLVTAPCDELTCEQGSLCVELDGEATCQPLTTCTVGKDCLGRGLCFGNQIWQANGVCSDGFCEMQELRGCEEECEEFTLYYNNGTFPSCSEDHLCGDDSDCDDGDSCTDNLCIYTPHVGVLACNYSYKGEASICELEDGDQGRCYDGFCQIPVGQINFVDNPSQPDAIHNHNFCVASFVTNVSNTEDIQIKDLSFLNLVGGDVVAAPYWFDLYLGSDFVAKSIPFKYMDPITGEYTPYDVLLFEGIDVELEKGTSNYWCLRFDTGLPSALMGSFVHFMVHDWEAVGLSSGEKVGENYTLGKKVQIGSY